jgi:hypothetical protein
MPTYKVLSGESYKIEADTPKEAEDKYFAFINGEDCLCGDIFCKCCEEWEADTLVIEC